MPPNQHGLAEPGTLLHHGGVDTLVSVGRGAATSVLLAASPLLDGAGGRYFEDCQEAVTVEKRPANNVGVVRYALNHENARRLWDVPSN